MYVDKHLSGIRAVQTLSRLNRFHPKKPDTFVLDFMNTTEVIQESFGDYYRTTILSDETDPNKLHDLRGGMDKAQVYSQEEIDDLVQKYLAEEERSTFEPILGQCAERYVELTEDEQVRFKGSAKSFTRLYGFLSQNPAVYQRRLGETIHLLELPHTEAAGAGGAGPVPGDTGSRRHGDIPD